MVLMMKNFNNKKILFIGDSLTECYDFKKHFPSLNIINEGVSAYTTLTILTKLNEYLIKHNPDVIFLLIGANDLELTNLTANEIIVNIKLIIKRIKAKNKDIKIYLQSVYPVDCNIKPFSVGKRKNEDIVFINNHIKTIKDVTYIDMHKILKNDEGKLNSNYTYDGIHINDLGYEVITQELNKYL